MVWKLYRRLGRCSAGTSMVELALVLPILLVIMIGFFEFGRALHHHHMMEVAVRDAARFLARSPETGMGGNACGAPAAGTPAAQAQRLAMYGTTLPGVQPLLPYWHDGQPQEFCIHGPTPRTMTAPDGTSFTVRVIRLEAQVTYEGLGLLALLGLESLPLRAAHEQIHVGN